LIKQRIAPPGEMEAVRRFLREHPDRRPRDGSDHPLSRWDDDPLVHAAGCGCYHTGAGDEITDARCAAMRLASNPQ
jgi:hypothetical protein